MKIIVLDGREYILVPKEQLIPIENKDIPILPQDTSPAPAKSILEDFLSKDDTIHIDDGLATLEEKQEAIKVVNSSESLNVPKAQPKKYLYREKFLKKELTPYDVMVLPSINWQHLKDNPEDPFIKADEKKPRPRRLFYGPGMEYEGYS